ncbi:carboxypeptidase-like regulatory domain-containing protein [Mucilaginibacter glaciei]|uniref:carboxypeptidase-like regulatory domain-containing protein n=1 Tax=Mucilaginibacter glaciei TaxID=2772109 RepID=UPI001746F0AB|nr:carboxypeptidase-like regulatory domain-containing protein [Mucilaginibacter glaciei]
MSILTCLFLPVIVLAQGGTITGKIISAASKAPVPKASVFLSNATFGTATDDEGNFSLRGVKPGQYDLVVTTLGFEEYSKKILVGAQAITLNIELTPKIMMMKSVTIISNADWKKNYEQFKKDFIGTTDNAKECKVINPRVLDLIYYRKKQELQASADEFLIMENYALGYRVKYLLNNFSSNNISRMIEYSGKILFEELPGSESQKKKWKQRREDTYYGSAQQFYRSLYKNTLTEDGFVIYNFSRVLNQDRFPEEFIQKKFKQFKDINRDSAVFWQRQNDVPKWAQENLMKPPLAANRVLRSTEQEGLYVVTFPYLLYVIYTKKREETYFRDIYRPLDMENYETSVITLLQQPYILFDRNGSVLGNAPLYEGTWSKAKLANMLPVDYEPGD